MPVSKKKSVVKQKQTPKPKTTKHNKKKTDVSSNDSNDVLSYTTTSEQENEVPKQTDLQTTATKNISLTNNSEIENTDELEIDENIENPDDNKDEEDKEKEKVEEDDDDIDDTKPNKDTAQSHVFIGDDEEEHDDADCVYQTNAQDILDDDELSDYDFYENDIPKVSYIPEDDRQTTSKLTVYERVRILSERTKQISTGAQTLVPNANLMSPEEVAKLELKMGVCPFFVERLLPSNKIELIDVNKLRIVN